MRPGMKNMSPVVRYVFITPWYPANRLEWYRLMILSTHISGIAKSTASLSGIVTNLNNKKCSRMNFQLVLLPYIKHFSY